MRTRYFIERETVGVAIAPGALARDFLIGLESEDWTNAGGLSGAQVGQLIATEFAPALRKAFHKWHATPDPIWPPQEEYSVLYASFYRSRPFQWRTSLPDTGVVSGQTPQFRFVTAFVPTFEGPREAISIHSLDHSIRIPASLFRMIASGELLSWQEHCRSGAMMLPGEVDSELRDYVDSLIELGLLAIQVPLAAHAETHHCEGRTM